MAKKTCPQCGRRLMGGQYPNYVKCAICGSEYCYKCSTAGLCPTHYESLTADDKKEVKKVYRLSIFLLFICLIAGIVGFTFLMVFSTEAWQYVLFIFLIIVYILSIIVLTRLYWKRKVKALFSQHQEK